MKDFKTIMPAIMAILVMLAGCKTSKTATGTLTATATKSQTTQSPSNIALIRQVADHASSAQNIVAKVKFSARGITLSGNLRMRRNDCIQLQLIALGLMEAARVELTPDYLLLIDRLHKRYTKIDYTSLELLSANGIDFYAMQSLFWGELFIPGTKALKEKDLQGFQAKQNGMFYTITLAEASKPKTELMRDATLSWQISDKTSEINTTDIKYLGKKQRIYQMKWQYADYAPFCGKTFPMRNTIKVNTSRLKLDAEMMLTSISNDDDWENRTTVSSRYEQVGFEELMDGLTQY